MPTQSEWKYLKSNLLKILQPAEREELKIFLDQKLELFKILGLESLVYDFFKTKSCFTYGKLDLSPLKKLTQIKIYEWEKVKQIKLIADFIENPIQKNFKKLQEENILANIDFNEYELDLFVSDYDDNLYDQIIQDGKTVEKLTRYLLNDLRLASPLWMREQVFQALCLPNASHMTAQLLSDADTTTLYKLQFCEPRKLIQKSGRKMFFLGTQTHRIYISTHQEITSEEGLKKYRLVDYLVDTNNYYTQTMHFDPFHETMDDAHRNYNKDGIDDDKLAQIIGQPKELLNKYFESIAYGAHTHIYFQKLIDYYRNTTPNDQLPDEYTPSIAISVPNLALYTRDIFIATALNSNEEVNPEFYTMLDIDQSAIVKTEAGEINYKTLPKKNKTVEHEIPASILDSDLGMHYTMFSEGALTYNPVTFMQYLLKVIDQKEGHQFTKAKEDVNKLIDFLTKSKQGQSYMTFLITETSSSNQSAFDTDSRILQNFNSSVIYLDPATGERKNAKPIESTFIVALLFKIFNGIHKSLSPQEQNNLISILQGKMPVSELLKINNVHLEQGDTQKKHENSENEPER